MKIVTGLIAVFLVTILGLMAYVRLAPTDPGLWNIDIAKAPGVDWTAVPAASGQVVVLPNGALATISVTPDQAQATLARLDAVALTSPRTKRLAGSTAEGRMTWETRSKLWGFPDYTTAQITAQTTGTGSLQIYARQRFGSQDKGVNAARLNDWLARL